jgi:xanthine dehydrogenase YagS FAD-binding subunit
VSAPAFGYVRANSLAEAVAEGARPGSAFVAGGTDLLQLWKAGVQAPERVVDISRLPIAGVAASGGRLSLGALARLGDVAGHPEVARNHPLVAQAIAASASGQVRNMATVGGNLLQRTRCVYFRNQHLPCNKRAPGSGCGARAGENRQHALFGASEACAATHPSDLVVALVALDAKVDILGTDGTRRIGLADLYRLPGTDPARDTVLSPGDLITAVEIAGAACFAPHSTYLKIRDRASFEFAVVSVAAALRLEDGVIVEARLAAGGIAPAPWRLAGAEAALVGRTPGVDIFAAAAASAVDGARPLAHNGFKVELLRRAIVRALATVGGEP